MRIIPKGLEIKLDWNSWDPLPIFKFIGKAGDVPEEDMRRTFNLGIGLILIIDKNETDSTIELLSDEKPVVMGEII
jgi:phosphoribosylformylglycinamidine cyclo-ligase